MTSIEPMPLAHRVFLITGAAGGIGRATAGVIAERGGRVVLVDLVAPSEYVESLGNVALGLDGDVTVAGDVDRAVAATLDRFGRLDGLVHAAGIVERERATDSTLASWRRQLEVNLLSAVSVSQAVAAVLRAGEGGAIVHIASNCGKVGYDRMAAYNASKAGVISLVRSLASEWADDGINVNAVCPGGVDTSMLRAVAAELAAEVGRPAEELLEEMGPRQLGRRVAPVEVARVVAFLLSDDARIIRGQSISVDAGDTPY